MDCPLCSPSSFQFSYLINVKVSNFEKNAEIYFGVNMVNVSSNLYLDFMDYDNNKYI